MNRYPKFPTAPIIDTCERADESPATGWTRSGPWHSGIATDGLRITSNELRSNAAAIRQGLWTGDALANDMEFYCTIEAGLGNFEIYFGLVDPATVNVDGYFVHWETTYCSISRFTNSTGGIVALGASIAATIANGDSVGVRRWGTTIEVWHKPAAGEWTRLGTREDATHQGGGFFGLVLNSTVTLSNIGARNVRRPIKRGPSTELGGVPSSRTDN